MAPPTPVQNPGPSSDGGIVIAAGRSPLAAAIRRANKIASIARQCSPSFLGEFTFVGGKINGGFPVPLGTPGVGRKPVCQRINGNGSVALGEIVADIDNNGNFSAVAADPATGLPAAGDASTFRLWGLKEIQFG
jgi:hypothetical protein